MNQSAFSNSRVIAWSVWLIASIFYAYQYVLRVMPNVMLEDIMQHFHIQAATFGQFSGIYYLGYSLMHLPVGILLDRYGPRKVMTICILLTVLGVAPLVLAERWAYPVIGRCLIGIGSSAAILGVFKVIRMTFHEKRFPRMLGFSVMIGLIGAIYGGGPVSYMRDTLGYPWVIQLLALGGILLAIFTFWMVPELKNSPKTSVLSDLKHVLGNRRVLWICTFAGLMVGPLEGFADVWGTTFLKHVYGFEGVAAASLPSMIFMGMCFGAPLLSLIAEKVGNHFLTVLGTGIVMGVNFFFLLFFHLTPTLLSLSFMIVGVCCAYQILAIHKASTYVREESAGLTTAMANMIIMIFGYIFHTIIGYVVQVLGGIQAPKALFFGVSMIPLALFLGTSGFFYLFLEEKRAKEPILEH